MKVRITRSLLASLPVEVSDAIVAVQNRFPHYSGKGSAIKSFSFQVKPAGKTIWMGEGEQITFIYRGQTQTGEMAAAHNVGSAGLSQKIDYSPPLPAGTVVLQVAYLGGYYLTVTSIDDTLQITG